MPIDRDFQRECRRAFIQAYNDLDKHIAAATGDRMRVFEAAVWEARSSVFPASAPLSSAPGFVFSVGQPEEVGDGFSTSFSITPVNLDHAGIRNASRANAFAVAEEIAIKIVSELERSHVGLGRWTEIRNAALQRGQLAAGDALNALEKRRWRVRIVWIGIGLAVVATIIALAVTAR